MKTAVLVYLDVVGDSAYGRPMDDPPPGQPNQKSDGRPKRRRRAGLYFDRSVLGVVVENRLTTPFHIRLVSHTSKDGSLIHL